MCFVYSWMPCWRISLISLGKGGGHKSKLFSMILKTTFSIIFKRIRYYINVILQMPKKFILKHYTQENNELHDLLVSQLISECKYFLSFINLVRYIFSHIFRYNLLNKIEYKEARLKTCLYREKEMTIFFSMFTNDCRDYNFACL